MKIKVYVVDVKLPRWLRRTLFFGGVPAVLLGLCALGFAALPAPVKTTFADGDVLNAEQVNALGKNVTDLDSRLVTLQNQVNTLSTNLGTANTNITSLQTAVAAVTAFPGKAVWLTGNNGSASCDEYCNNFSCANASPNCWEGTRTQSCLAAKMVVRPPASPIAGLNGAYLGCSQKMQNIAGWNIATDGVYCLCATYP